MKQNTQIRTMRGKYPDSGQQMESELSSNHRSNYTSRAPLTGEITAAKRRPETFEEQEKIELHASLHFLSGGSSTRTDVTKALAFLGLPIIENLQTLRR